MTPIGADEGSTPFPRDHGQGDVELAIPDAVEHLGSRPLDDREVDDRILRADRPIVVELTEQVRIDDYRLVRSALATLGDVGLAVDDAGAGFASLRHILELRPTFAKLDISLVGGIDRDDVRQALAAGLHYFASRIGCRLIAEGVETRGEADVLSRLGIELGQGYLFGRPELGP
jgi:EAL domain-containing protein (putative c-di-GMP-specific phosphodiesterase class I)